MDQSNFDSAEWLSMLLVWPSFQSEFLSFATMHRALILFSCAVLAAKASNVLEFTDANFKDKIKELDVALVEFYAPW